jgi:hypothetical protein
MPFQLGDEDTWFGEGLLWKRLIIRNLDGTVQGLMMNAVPSYIKDKQIDLSHCNSLDEAIDELRKEDFDYYDELTLYADEEEVVESPDGKSHFSTIDGALENWGRLNESRHVWKEINEVLSRLEVKLGRLTELHIPGSRNYVAAHFSDNPTNIGAYINVGHVDHNEFLEGSEWSEIRRNYRSYLSTSAGNVPKRIAGVGKKSNPCPTCGIVMSQVNSCDYCP